jgi:hypothetical protein
VQYLANGPFLSALLFQQLQTIDLNKEDSAILIKEVLLLAKSLSKFIVEQNLNKFMH